MSLFGRSSSVPAGGNSLPSLNLNTNAEEPLKRKSPFDTASSSSQPQSNMFGSTPKTSAPFGGSSAAPAASGFTFGPAPTSGPNLFGTGTNPATTTASNSIFGTGLTSPGTTNLFGKPGTTTASSFGGLFAQTATTSAPSGGLFGNTTTSAPSGGLFGNSTTNNNASSNSQFGSRPQATSSLFSQPPQQSEAVVQQQPPNKDPAYFSSLLERQKKKARLNGVETSSRLGTMPGLNMDLGDLARRAQELGGKGARQSTAASDSRAHYLLAGSGVAPGQAYRNFQALDGDENQTETRAQTDRLAEESTTYLRDLRLKGRDAMMRESMDRVYREVDTFIEQSLGIDFEEQKQKIMEHFGLVPKEDRDDAPVEGGSFGRSSRRPGSSSGKSTRSVFGRSALEKSIIGTPAATSIFGNETAPPSLNGLTRGQTARDLRDKERLFVEKIEALNDVRLKDNSFPIFQTFAQVEETAGGDVPKQVIDSYHALREITQEYKLTSDPNAIKERQYATAYLDDNTESAQALRLRKQILEGSRTYLEKAFYRELENLVDKNPREAQLGGRPTVINKIRAYIRVRAARRDLAPDGSELQQIGENGDYCWILIFHLLRSGFFQEAAEYVRSDSAFQSTDRRFVSYMTTYAESPDRRLTRKLQEMIDGEYQQRAKVAPKGTVDPYRMACYKIIGRCDLGARNLDAVGQGVEDWIWLQFALARESDRLEELSGELFGLDQICETITEIGQKHFQKSQVEGSAAYGTFFLMQVLAGLFEQAVDYLHNFNPVSAVHFAIALAYYGLLRVSDHVVAGNELLTHSTKQEPLINFVPLIAYHTASFRTALPTAAVDYLSLICLNSDLQPVSLGNAQTNACHECLRELCLETREFAKLLGDIRSDGQRIPGAIEKKATVIRLQTHEEFLKNITSQAAAVADQRGQIADTVLLYHLCGDFDNVVTVLNRALADAVSLDLGDSPMQLQPLKPRGQGEQNGEANSALSSLSLTQSTSSPVELARNMISLYNSNAAYYNLISQSARDTCGALLRLLNVRQLLEANPPRYMDALSELNDLNILPLNAEGSIPIIRQAASSFGTLPQLLARCAGISVVWAVRAIGGERENLMQHGSWQTGYGGDRDGMKEQLNSMAKDLMVFAGLVKYKLPATVYDMLTRAGGDVGRF